MNEKFLKATYQQLGDAAKAVLRGKCIAANTYMGKRRLQINNWVSRPTT